MAASMSADFLGAREQDECHAPFSGEDFIVLVRKSLSTTMQGNSVGFGDGSKRSNIGPTSADGAGRQRVPLAHFAVLSPGPRLAAARNGQGKNGEKWRIFEAQERHSSVLGAPLLNTMDWFGCFYVGRLLWRSRDERMSGAIFE